MSECFPAPRATRHAPQPLKTSWQFQLADSLITPEQLAERFVIDPEPLRAVVARYPLLITPHTLALIEEPDDPIWRQCVPDLS